MLASNNKPMAPSAQLDAGSVRGTVKFSCSYDNAQSAQKQLGALQKQDKLAWITNTPDGTSHVFWMTGPNLNVPSELSVLHFPR